MNIFKSIWEGFKRTRDYFKSIKSDSDKYKLSVKRFNKGSIKRFKLNDEI